MKLLVCLCLCIAGASAGSLSAFTADIASAASFGGDVWAVLVAGSNGWSNYRHQADVCHAYQILKSHGVPDERIIVMMYDDIADNDNNPTPGKIINRPNGPNVYAGVPKDYVGRAVTSKNFLKVLQGDAGLKAAGNKVLGANENDHVFVFFSDHGAPGLVAFPSDTLYAKDFIATLDKLHAGNRYSRMVVYIEACEAGSMFDGLLKSDHRIFGVSAANPDEPSWAYYCDSGTCLGDEFSVKWMEDSDRVGDLSKSTLSQQFERVKKAVVKSEVSRYGDFSFTDSHLSEFQGEKATDPVDEVSASAEESEFLSIRSYDVALHVAEMKAQMTNSDLEVKKVEAMRKGRDFVDTVTEYLANELEEKHGLPYPLLGAKEKLVHHDCYKTLVEAYNEHCFNVAKHSYALRSLYLFVNACHNLQDDATAAEKVAATIGSFCKANVVDHPYRAVL